MTETLKLFNRGQRSIVFDEKGSVFGPGKLLELPNEIGKNLKRLFPDELISMEDAEKQFAAMADNATVQKMPELETFESGLANQSAPVATPELTPAPVPVELSEADKKAMMDNATDIKENKDGTFTFSGKHEDGTAYELTVDKDGK